MKLFILLLVFSSSTFAQYSVSATSSTTAAAEINSKPAIQSGTSAPSGNCTAGKDLYVNTATSALYGCTATNNWSLLLPVGFGLTTAGGAIAINGAAVTTTPNNQSGVQLFCNDTLGNPLIYSCSLATSGSAALTQYTNGMVVRFVSTGGTATSATLNIDGVGPKTVYKADCTTQIGTDIAPNQMYQLWYNGAVGVQAFCLVH